MSIVTLVSKISVKKVCGELTRPEAKTALLRIFGIAMGSKTVPGNYDLPAIALLGQFRAINLSTGEIFQSGICYVPKIGVDLILPLLKSETVEGLEFSFNIGIVPAKNNYGYEYYVEPIFEPSETDPLEVLSQRVAQATLPAPVSDKAHAPEKDIKRVK